MNEVNAGEEPENQGYPLTLNAIIPCAVYTVDREIFTLKIIRVKNFRGVKFSRYRLIREIFFNR